MFRMKYDPSELIVRNVTYEIRRNTKEQIPPKCKDNQYTLGSEVYKDTIEGTVESLYANQAKIFEEFKAPSVTPPCEGEKCPLPQPNPCENNNDCLDKYSLIPIDQFHLFRNRPLLCSNLFTTPIWKDATKGALEKLDRYLYALFKFLDEKRLHVIAGVSPTQLMLPLKNQSPKKESKKEPVFLDHKNKKIPVPKFVYKLVKYYPRACDSKDKSCEYAVMFIAHNDPNFKPKDKICPGKEDFTTTLGWNAITTDIGGKQYNNIYACPNDKKVLKEIYSFKTILPSTPSPTPTSKNLNLQKFPVYDKSTNTVDENNDFVGQVDAMFNQLATNGERLEFKDIITWYQEDSENVEDMDEDSELESDSPKAESPRN
ncbi:uncharacterized protein LOC135841134 [Planococcus citri]|uniref:uncharacterized protein LOC135841134 n=1 Tax=Planococcus citri TaxID=170843 RepID=UPI0031F747EA